MISKRSSHHYLKKESLQVIPNLSDESSEDNDDSDQESGSDDGVEEDFEDNSLRLTDANDVASFSKPKSTGGGFNPTTSTSSNQIELTAAGSSSSNNNSSSNSNMIDNKPPEFIGTIHNLKGYLDVGNDILFSSNSKWIQES